MQLTTNEVLTEAFGFRIRSEIPFPELLTVQGRFENADLTVRLEPLSEEWAVMLASPRKIHATEAQILIHIPEAALFAVREGRVIAVSPVPGADMDKIRLYILGTCMGAVLMQRGVLPLHGSAVAVRGKVYAIVGESGMGKSTLASALMDRGLPLVSDDVIAIRFNEAGIPLVTPSYPQQKLWQESLDAFGMEASGLKPLFERETKFAVPVSDRFVREELPLGGVFELVKKADASPGLTPIEGLDRMRLLYEHTYRNLFLRRMGKLDWHFQVTARLAGLVPISRITRPDEGFTAHELAELLVKTIGEEE
ncbi:phosphoenolpyruvate carboxykinase (ATP) [Gorillibacterium timonense]|uniref:aldolase n=1 Tax=Gorillibacterium timonense TaxID=1689269 RepID=UPI00071DA243|nr:aldolase [Gorillibacterium timonense]